MCLLTVCKLHTRTETRLEPTDNRFTNDTVNSLSDGRLRTRNKLLFAVILAAYINRLGYMLVSLNSFCNPFIIAGITRALWCLIERDMKTINSTFSPLKWPSTSLFDDFFYLTDSGRPPAELKVASELCDQNPVGTLYETIFVLNANFYENVR